MNLDELNTLIDSSYADFTESVSPQTKKEFQDEISKYSCQVKTLNADEDSVSLQKWVADDFSTRQIISDGKKQSAIDYFDSEDSQKNKYKYRHFFYSMLLDQFKDQKFKTFDLIDWNKIVELSKDNYSCTYDFFMPNTIEENLVRVKGVFKSLGINYSYSNGKIKNENEVFTTISKYIETIIEKNGGENILNALMTFINNKYYDNALKRYIFTSDLHSLGEAPRFETPVNYLLHLCLKHINKQGLFNEDDFQSIINISSNFLFLYELQDFNIIDFMPLPGKMNDDYLYRNLLFDNIFRFRQYNYRKFPKILKQLLKTDNTRKDLFSKEQGYSLDDYVNFVEKIYLKENVFFNKPYYINGKRSAKELIILEMLSNVNKANDDYSLPTDFDKITTIEKPFVKKGDSYFLTNKIVSAWSFYSFISSLNENQKYLNVGDNIERIVKKGVPSDGRIKIYSGKYKNKAKEEAECDLVLEDSQYIIFIEIKKKTISGVSLTNKKNLIFDLVTMVMTSQAQALRHEINLRKDGQITFPTGDTLKYSNQRIYKISVTLFDLYSFNNHAFVMSLIQYLRNIKFSFENETEMSAEDRKKAIDMANIDGANRKIDLINKLIKELEDHHGVSERENRLYSYFFSLEQILFLFNECSKKGKLFGEILDSMKNISLGQKDFYSEYNQLHILKDSG